MSRILCYCIMIFLCVEFVSCGRKNKDGASHEAQAYLKEALTVIKENSIMVDSLDWDSLEKNAFASIVNANTQYTQDCYSTIKYVLRNLNDNHSFFMEPFNAQNWKEAELSSTFGFQTAILDSHIAYISVPGIDSGDSSSIVAYADSLQKKIAYLDKNTVEGWILDLRYNTGGNCWPMLAGIGPLLGEGTCGFFIMADGSKQDWFYRSGVAGVDSIGIVQVSSPYSLTIEDRPIAVLTSEKTASSGEVVTIAFHGKKNTKSFGQPTGGYTTGNSNFMLSDSAMIFLASSIYADRNEQLYRGEVVPDTVVETSHPTYDLTKNEVVLAAISWIKTNSQM